MVTKLFGPDFFSAGGALTLSVGEVSEDHNHTGFSSRTHESGWTIMGEVAEDYYTWVNTFAAFHPDYGIVAGNFEGEVVATSEEAFQHFFQHHEPQAWDYGDI